jgi:YVTN family beta-propeller protein
VPARRADGLYPVATVALDGFPRMTAVDRATRRVYVALEDRNELLVLDARSNAEIRRVPVAAKPIRVVVNSTTHKVYVIHHERGSQDMTVVDGRPGSPTEHSAVAAIFLGNRSVSPVRSIAIDEERNRIYVPTFDPGGRLLVIDGDGDRWMATVPVAANPISAAFDPLLRRVVLGHGSFFGRTRLTYYDVASGAVQDGPEVGLQTAGLWLDPATHRIYAGHGAPDFGDRYTMTALSAKTGRVLARFPQLGESYPVVHPRTGRLYAHSGDDPHVFAFDAARGSPQSFQLVSAADTAIGQRHIALDPDGDRLFVTQPEPQNILVLEDLNTRTDPRNCGACANVCAQNEVCREGQCIAFDAWRPTALGQAPPAVAHYRPQSNAVWTGNRMLVWGGSRDVGRSGEGGVYDPAHDTWSAISTAGAPAPRSDHTVVWTGREMIVWGGAPRTDHGARYNPQSRTWSPMTTAGAPEARSEHSAVWTGSKMIVWGGQISAGGPEATNTGGLYDPLSDTWSSVSMVGAPSPRKGHAVVWTGTEMIVWAGGFAGCPALGGGRYSPSEDVWRPVSTASAPKAYQAPRAVWTGRAMFVLGGEACNGAPTVDHAGLYDPGSDTWTKVDATSLGARVGNAIVWTGDRVLIWGGSVASVLAEDGALFNPSTHAFAPLPGGIPARQGIAAYVWTGLQLIVWGGADLPGTKLSSGGIYTPSIVED